MVDPTVTAGWRTWPLYAAGFTTAFGAHGIAASLGGYTYSRHGSLLLLGALLAVYDSAEVLLKPVFGGLADRIVARPMPLAGLAGFAVTSAAFAPSDSPGCCGWPASARAPSGSSWAIPVAVRPW